MVLPVGAKSFEEALQMGSETYHHLKVMYVIKVVIIRKILPFMLHTLYFCFHELFLNQIFVP